MPAAENTHVAVAVPVVLSTADAHTVDGAWSDALSDAYTATVPPITSNPVVDIATLVGTAL